MSKKEEEMKEEEISNHLRVLKCRVMNLRCNSVENQSLLNFKYFRK